MNKLILTSAYLGPVQYYTKFLNGKQVSIEQYDSYQKQTYRNRCQILGANGPLVLTVPIIKNSGTKTLVKDVLIDYATRWQSNHWRSISSAYNSSPFFEYFESDFISFYQKKWKFLIDYNLALHKVVAEILELDNNWQLTTDYEKEFKGNDYRFAISPKQHFSVVDSQFNPKIYSQTFSEKFDFVPNLSIIDLLFNLGPEASLILEESIVVPK